MAGHQIYLVIPEQIKKSVSAYRTSSSVISLKTFFDNYLNPAMVRWRQAGIIP